MKRTPLFDLHLEHGARMVDFAGWEMPLQYRTGIHTEHLAVREGVGLFDVSHMGEVRVTGPGAEAFLRYATLNDPSRLKPQQGQYSMLPNDRGGLIDDLYVYRDAPEAFLIVCNAANREAVVAHLTRLSYDYDATVTDESDAWALLALQGPGAALLAGRHAEAELTALKKNRTLQTTLAGCAVTLARTGYTGEDGFEIFCRPEDAPTLWRALVGAGATPCGLGARDTLRLEAGFPLFGHELGPETNPRCTDFAWVVKDKPFFGREAMWHRTCTRRLVGLRLKQRGVARPGYRVLAGAADVLEAESDEGTKVGEVTSGTISPLTREGIAMAWVRRAYSEPGTELAVEIRGQPVPAVVVKPPFYG
ncbi:glycine cleavage system aminomethyltransferase GcvT [Truepera radiovictrix]|uniref:aminomethyltransferase n=1 Tax=Truepera radiovictrix (strain DSM 17093 / CIP 108686 / LMG 22925 / RQ-24) TaxID=649638 RepID=D7CVI0_TRURR|nr:glycine cleavage system aminomethyltransferase GcvT [Truepera radiovictrix]ADI14208.1 glycine cleavage system T protein [Truepera radiovictrix DSM 17093]WMT57234.1 glycine cleavage system aminomethyltransferase GcvT [Truepera radiovictrix]